MDLAVDRLHTLQVADVMHRPAVSVSAKMALKQVAGLLRDQQLSMVPVVDESGHCVGILSASDLIRRMASEDASGPMSAKDYMSPAVQTVAPDAPILLAARIMCLQHLHRLVVLDYAGRPVGIISCMDITAALVNVVDELEMDGVTESARDR